MMANQIYGAEFDSSALKSPISGIPSTSNSCYANSDPFEEIRKSFLNANPSAHKYELDTFRSSVTLSHYRFTVPSSCALDNLNEIANIGDSGTSSEWLAMGSLLKSKPTFHSGRISSHVHATLLQVYMKSATGAETEALKVLFDSIESLFAVGKVESVDELLANFQPEKVKKLVSVGMMRGTFRARSILKAWDNCLARVASNLIENDQPASKLLRGLNPTHGRRLLTKKQAV